MTTAEHAKRTQRTHTPFTIAKRDVWAADQQVKANQGAAGIDGQTLAEFETKVKDNLYRIWNRLSSGSYVPPPVRTVEIPKASGSGMRSVGIPTVADRIAQMVVKRRIEPQREPHVHPDSYGYRLAIGHGSQRWTQCRSRGSEAGDRTGSSIWTSRASSTPFGTISCSRRCGNT